VARSAEIAEGLPGSHGCGGAWRGAAILEAEDRTHEHADGPGGARSRGNRYGCRQPLPITLDGEAAPAPGACV